jgi:hypothetical protein
MHFLSSGLGKNFSNFFAGFFFRVNSFMQLLASSFTCTGRDMELSVQQVEGDGVEVAVEEFLWIVIAYRKM